MSMLSGPTKLAERLLVIEAAIEALREKNRDLEALFEILWKFLEETEPDLADKFVEFFDQAVERIDQLDRKPEDRDLEMEGFSSRARISDWIDKYGKPR